MENATTKESKPKRVAKITIEVEGEESLRVEAVNFLLVGITAEGLEINRVLLGSAPKLIGLATEAIEQIRMFVDNDRAGQMIHAVVNKAVAELAAVQVQIANRNGRIAVP